MHDAVIVGKQIAISNWQLAQLKQPQTSINYETTLFRLALAGHLLITLKEKTSRLRLVFSYPKNGFYLGAAAKPCGHAVVEILVGGWTACPVYFSDRRFASRSPYP
jgi:hypothetical protein